MSRVLAGLAAGLLFGLGLLISGMSDPAKVLSFLDLGAIPSGGWDPSLALVMAGAAGTALVGYRLVMRRPVPALGGAFDLPKATDIDARLLGGAALFGVGWGLAGLCPGPLWTVVLTGAPGVLAFGAAMVLGLLMGRWARERGAGLPARA